MSILFALPLAAMAGSPAVAAAPAAATAPQTRQQRFDAASEAAGSGNCPQAVPMFEALEREGAVKPGSVPAAAISVRKGVCLVGMGRLDEGEGAVMAGLPALEGAGAPFAADVAFAEEALGKAALARADYAEAKTRLIKGLALLEGGDRVATLALLARASAFDAGPEPLAHAEEAIRLAEARAKPSKDLLAQLHSLHARILLNRGQVAPAYAELKRALELSGGLTLQTSMAEAALRGDLALAALLSGRKDDARLYLAYTGAGRIEASPFASGAVMTPPDCGEETGLKPSDYAVVQFGIGDEGQVLYADTVYTTGGPQVASAFARAVKDWYWRSDLLAKIPKFYRLATRVELRCSTAGGETPTTAALLKERFLDWARSHVAVAASPTLPAAIASLRTAYDEREAKGDAAGQVAIAGVLAAYDPVNDREMVARIDRALVAGEKAGVPAQATNYLRIQRLLTASAAAQATGARRRFEPLAPEAYLGLLQDPAIAADPLASGWLLLAAATPQADHRPRPKADEWLLRVADDGRLPEHHPLRQVARLKLANRAAALGDIATAQSYFAATGLTEQQCALVGATPSLRRTGAEGGDFPMEAMRFGFEGWVRLEFDISPDGKPAGVRPIVAYPPFVFVDAAQGMSRDFRYESSYRPSGGPACSAKQETVRFILPR